MGWGTVGVADPLTVENPNITFDSPKLNNSGPFTPGDSAKRRMKAVFDP